jgi:hypothetical protein
MTNSLIILLELGLFSLLLLLAFRVLSLNRSEPLMSAMPAEAHSSLNPLANPARERLARSQVDQVNRSFSEPGPGPAPYYPDKCELIPQLHILASLQARDCKQKELELETAHPAVREYAVCWLYGASCALGRPSKRNSEALAVLVSQFASRKIGIRQSDALAVILTLTRDSASLACFRSGIEGAEFWKTHHYVPREKSLFEAVTSNTFV